jgi:NAD-specific glutamate dehydrogenase
MVSDAVAALARTYLRRGAPVQPSLLVADDLSIAEALADVPSSGEAVNELLALGVDRSVAERWPVVEARALTGDVGPVVRATGRPVDEVLRAFALVDDAAGVPRMVRALRQAATPDRWRSWLTRATLDDLADWRVAAVLDAFESGRDPADPLVGWPAEHDASLSAARRLLLALEAAGADPTTVVAVALRRLPKVSTGRRP